MGNILVECLALAMCPETMMQWLKMDAELLNLKELPFLGYHLDAHCRQTLDLELANLEDSYVMACNVAKLTSWNISTFHLTVSVT